MSSYTPRTKTPRDPVRRIGVSLEPHLPLARELTNAPGHLGWTVDADPGLSGRIGSGAYDLLVLDKPDALTLARRVAPTSTRVFVPPPGELCRMGAQLAHHLLPPSARLDELAMVVDCAAGGLGLVEVPLPQGALLPAMPQDAQRLVEVLDNPDATVRQVLAAASRDPALVAKILQLANSPYFQLARQVSSLEHAVGLLGVSAIRSATLAGRCFDAVPSVPEEEIARVRERGLRTMRLIRQLAGAHAEVAVTAALLMDIGQLLLLSTDPAYPKLRRRARQAGHDLLELEREQYGATHAQIGAALLHEWGLPDAVVHAIAFSHTPFPLPSRRHEPRTWLFIASALVDGAEGEAPPLDPSWVAHAGVLDLIEEGRVFLEDLTVVT